MKKLTTWAKSHKLAAIFAGTGALIVAGFVLIMALGIIFVSTGMVEPEPAAQEAEPAKAEKKPAKTTAPAKAEKAEAKPEKSAEVKAEPKAEKPKETKPSPKKAEPKKTTPAKPKPKADPLKDRLEATQKDLDVWFEDCDWEDDKFNNGFADYVTSVCATENLGIIATEDDAAAKLFLTGAAEEAPIGKYFIDDGLAVWSINGGTLNQAWDALGAPGYPKDMADLAK